MRLIRTLLALVGCLALACFAQNLSAIPQRLGYSNLTGAAVALDPFDLSITTNATHAIVLFNISQSFNKVGWAAFATGTRMSDADMIIVWPNPSSQTWTISHRTAPYGHGEPDTQDNTQDNLEIIPELSTNGTSGTRYTQVAFLRQMKPTYQSTSTELQLQQARRQSILYAYCSSNPGSTSTSATMDQHDMGAYGVVNMDLSKSVNFPSPDSTNNTIGDNITATEPLQPEAAIIEWTHHDSIIVLHALCGCLAFLIISPAAILLARLGRHLENWLRLHKLFQSLLTVPLCIASVILGVVAVHMSGGEHFGGTHKVLGLLIMLALLLQAPLGYYIHHKLDVKRSRRPLRNIFHIIVGMILTALAFYQVWKGMRLYGLSFNRNAPGWIYAIYYLIVASVGLTIILSLGRVVQKRRMQGHSWRNAAFGLGRNTPDPYGISPVARGFKQTPLQALHSASNSDASIKTIDFDQHGQELKTLPALERTLTSDTITEEKLR